MHTRREGKPNCKAGPVIRCAGSQMPSTDLKVAFLISILKIFVSKIEIARNPYRMGITCIPFFKASEIQEVPVNWA
jgi:hypothetical protein